MKKLLCIIFIINSLFTFSQETEKRIYIISVITQPQTVELIEYENGQYAGNIITKITKGKRQTGWLNHTWKNLWNKESKDITDKNPIAETVVEKLMIKLRDKEIETIKDCNQDEDCKEQMFLDNGTIYFKIKTADTIREYAFEEIYPLDEMNREKIELRVKAQNLITILYEHADLKQNFSDFFKRLPRGNYFWYQASGNSIATIKIRKRKNK